MDGGNSTHKLTGQTWLETEPGKSHCLQLHSKAKCISSLGMQLLILCEGSQQPGDPIKEKQKLNNRIDSLPWLR